jgi:hypothetical protein
MLTLRALLDVAMYPECVFNTALGTLEPNP